MAFHGGPETSREIGVLRVVQRVDRLAFPYGSATPRVTGVFIWVRNVTVYGVSKRVKS